MNTVPVLYDCEFLERPASFISPISIGMVRLDTGDEYYAEFADMPTLEIARHNWLMENVMTSIPHEEFTSHITGTGQPVKDFRLTGPSVKFPWEIRQEIMYFVEDIIPEWWAWYGAYDHVVLAQLFGRMIDLPAGFPMMTQDLKQLHTQAKYCEMPKQPSGKHNALDDARFNVVRYNYLMEQLKAQDTKRITGILDRAAGI